MQVIEKFYPAKILWFRKKYLLCISKSFDNSIYMHITDSRASRFALLSGIMLLSVSVLFWIAVVFSEIFGQPGFFESTFSRIDHISPLLSIMLVIVLPLIAIALNLISLLKLELGMGDENIFIHILFHRNWAQWALIAFAGISTGLILVYLFLENFSIVAR